MGVVSDLTPNQKTQRQFDTGRNGPFYGGRAGPYNPYAGILAPGGGLAGGHWQEANAVNRPGMAPIPPATAVASNPMLPRPRPWDAPSSMDVAAMNRNPAVDAINSLVPGAQQPPTTALGYGPGAGGAGMPPAPGQGGGDLGALFAGLAGLLGLAGGGNAAQPAWGAERPMIGNGQGGPAMTSFKGSSTGRDYQVGQTYQGTNGYSYEARPDGTFKQIGRTDPAADKARGAAIGETNRRNPNPTYNVSGSNNSFEPRSVQNSERWQTGY